DRGAPAGGVEAAGSFFGHDLPERLEGGAAVSRELAGPVEGGGAGVDQVEDPAGGGPGEPVAGDALHRLGAPVGAHVGEELRGAGEEVAEKHGGAVEGVVLGGDHVGLADAVPVEGS